MQITRETDYAVRCVLYLCKNPQRITIAEEIAAAQAIPKSFLSKILQKLSKAGIVASRAGVKGGFSLARNPEDITLLTVIEAIEGTPALNVCVVDQGACDFSRLCSVHWAWIDIQKKMIPLLKQYTFKRLLTMQKKMEKKGGRHGSTTGV